MRLAALLGLAAILGLAQPARAQDAPEALKAEAFEAAQWAIASEAADALSQVAARFAQGDDALGRLAEERETLVQRRDRLERRSEQLYVSQDPAETAERSHVRIEHEAVVARMAEVEADLRTRFPAYADLTNPGALSIPQVQTMLRAEEGLLLVLSNPEATYVWALSRERSDWTRVELTETDLAQAVTALRASLTSATGRRSRGALDPAVYAGLTRPRFDRGLAHALYDRMIRPIEGVFDGKDVLLTVVSGPLTSLPLAALPTADHGQEAWLGDRYALAALPSVSSLEALRCHLEDRADRRPAACPPSARPARREEARLALAAFGAPALNGAPDVATRGAADAGNAVVPGRLADTVRLKALPALPGSLAELKALADRYPSALVRTGADATETAVRGPDAAALAQARFVVFSTHGLMAGGAAAEPGLVLTPPEQATVEDDGYLSASEAAQLKLNAEFVVLSACNTAAPDGRPGAEGLSGLARAFLYAGARSLLVSHWEVSDAATSSLILETFSRLDAGAQDPAARARALQSAMRTVRADPRWSHPAYWAAFTLVGAPG